MVDQPRAAPNKVRNSRMSNEACVGRPGKMLLAGQGDEIFELTMKHTGQVMSIGATFSIPYSIRLGAARSAIAHSVIDVIGANGRAEIGYIAGMTFALNRAREPSLCRLQRCIALSTRDKKYP